MKCEETSRKEFEAFEESGQFWVIESLGSFRVDGKITEYNYCEYSDGTFICAKNEYLYIFNPIMTVNKCLQAPILSVKILKNKIIYINILEIGIIYMDKTQTDLKINLSEISKNIDKNFKSCQISQNDQNISIFLQLENSSIFVVNNIENLMTDRKNILNFRKFKNSYLLPTKSQTYFNFMTYKEEKIFLKIYRFDFTLNIHVEHYSIDLNKNISIFSGIVSFEVSDCERFCLCLNSQNVMFIYHFPFFELFRSYSEVFDFRLFGEIIQSVCLLFKEYISISKFPSLEIIQKFYYRNIRINDNKSQTLSFFYSSTEENLKITCLKQFYFCDVSQVLQKFVDNRLYTESIRFIKNIKTNNFETSKFSEIVAITLEISKNVLYKEYIESLNILKLIRIDDEIIKTVINSDVLDIHQSLVLFERISFIGKHHQNFSDLIRLCRLTILLSENISIRYKFYLKTFKEIILFKKAGIKQIYHELCYFKQEEWIIWVFKYLASAIKIECHFHIIEYIDCVFDFFNKNNSSVLFNTIKNDIFDWVLNNAMFEENQICSEILIYLIKKIISTISDLKRNFSKDIHQIYEIVRIIVDLFHENNKPLCCVEILENDMNKFWVHKIIHSSYIVAASFTSNKNFDWWNFNSRNIVMEYNSQPNFVLIEYFKVYFSILEIYKIFTKFKIIISSSIPINSLSLALFIVESFDKVEDIKEIFEYLVSFCVIHNINLDDIIFKYISDLSNPYKLNIANYRTQEIKIIKILEFISKPDILEEAILLILEWFRLPASKNLINFLNETRNKFFDIYKIYISIKMLEMKSKLNQLDLGVNIIQLHALNDPTRIRSFINKYIERFLSKFDKDLDELFNDITIFSSLFKIDMHEISFIFYHSIIKNKSYKCNDCLDIVFQNLKIQKQMYLFGFSVLSFFRDSELNDGLILSNIENMLKKLEMNVEGSYISLLKNIYKEILTRPDITEKITNNLRDINTNLEIKNDSKMFKINDKYLYNFSINLTPNICQILDDSSILALEEEFKNYVTCTNSLLRKEKNFISRTIKILKLIRKINWGLKQKDFKIHYLENMLKFIYQINKGSIQEFANDKIYDLLYPTKYYDFEIYKINDYIHNKQINTFHPKILQEYANLRSITCFIAIFTLFDKSSYADKIIFFLQSKYFKDIKFVLIASIYISLLSKNIHLFKLIFILIRMLNLHIFNQKSLEFINSRYNNLNTDDFRYILSNLPENIFSNMKLQCWIHLCRSFNLDVGTAFKIYILSEIFDKRDFETSLVHLFVHEINSICKSSDELKLIQKSLQDIFFLIPSYLYNFIREVAVVIIKIECDISSGKTQIIKTIYEKGETLHKILNSYERKYVKSLIEKDFLENQIFQIKKILFFKKLDFSAMKNNKRLPLTLIVGKPWEVLNCELDCINSTELYQLVDILQLNSDQFIYCIWKNTLKFLSTSDFNIFAKSAMHNNLMLYKKLNFELWAIMRNQLEKMENFELSIRLATETAKYLYAESNARFTNDEPRKCRIEVLEWIHVKIKFEIKKIISYKSEFRVESKESYFKKMKKHYRDALLVWRLSNIDYILQMYNFQTNKKETIIIDPEKFLVNLWNERFDQISLTGYGNSCSYLIFKKICLVSNRLCHAKIVEILLKEWIDERISVNEAILKITNIIFSMIFRCQNSIIESSEILKEVSYILKNLKNNYKLKSQMIFQKINKCFSIVSLFMEYKNIDEFICLETFDKNKLIKEYHEQVITYGYSDNSSTHILNNYSIIFFFNTEKFSWNEFIEYISDIDFSGLDIKELITIFKKINIISRNQNEIIIENKRIWNHIWQLLHNSNSKREDEIFFICNNSINPKDFIITENHLKLSVSLIILFFRYYMEPTEDFKYLHEIICKHKNTMEIGIIINKIKSNNIFKKYFNIYL